MQERTTAEILALVANDEGLRSLVNHCVNGRQISGGEPEPSECVDEKVYAAWICGGCGNIFPSWELTENHLGGSQ